MVERSRVEDRGVEWSRIEGSMRSRTVAWGGEGDQKTHRNDLLNNSQNERRSPSRLAQLPAQSLQKQPCQHLNLQYLVHMANMSTKQSNASCYQLKKFQILEEKVAIDTKWQICHKILHPCIYALQREENKINICIS